MAIASPLWRSVPASLGYRLLPGAEETWVDAEAAGPAKQQPTRADEMPAPYGVPELDWSSRYGIGTKKRSLV